MRNEIVCNIEARLSYFLNMIKLLSNELNCKSEARLHFDIYDFEGESKVDYLNLGDLLRSLDLRPTQAMIEKNGGTKKKGQHQL